MKEESERRVVEVKSFIQLSDTISHSGLPFKPRKYRWDRQTVGAGLEGTGVEGQYSHPVFSFPMVQQGRLFP